jgi:copper(I)-binding protein
MKRGFAFHRHPGPGSARQGRAPARSRGARAPAIPSAARGADCHRSRIARLRGYDVVRRAGAGRRAEGYRRAAQPRDRQDHEYPGYQRAARGRARFETKVSALWYSALLILCAFAPALVFAQVNVNLPWVRSTAQAQKSAAVYMKLEAHVTGSIALVGASSPLAKSVEIRAARNSGRKADVARLEIPAGSSVLLKPGAPHLMLVGLKQSLKKGGSVPLRLDFETKDAARFSVNITAAIVSANAKSALDHHH